MVQGTMVLYGTIVVRIWLSASRLQYTATTVPPVPIIPILPTVSTSTVLTVLRRKLVLA